MAEEVGYVETDPVIVYGMIAAIILMVALIVVIATRR